MQYEFLKRQKDDFWRDLTSLGSMWFYSILMILFLILRNYVVFNKLLIGFVLIYLITIIIRATHFKNRPRKYSYANFIEKLDASAFPSLHATRSGFLFMILVKYFNNLFVSIILFVLLIVVSYSRIYLKKHDIRDVSVGVGLGVVVYVIVNWLHSTIFV